MSSETIDDPDLNIMNASHYIDDLKCINDISKNLIKDPDKNYSYFLRVLFVTSVNEDNFLGYFEDDNTVDISIDTKSQIKDLNDDDSLDTSDMTVEIIYSIDGINISYVPNLERFFKIAEENEISRFSVSEMSIVKVKKKQN